LNQQDDHQADQSERKKREPGLFSRASASGSKRRCPRAKSQPLGKNGGQRKAVWKFRNGSETISPDSARLIRGTSVISDGGRLAVVVTAWGGCTAASYTRVVYRALWRKSLPPLRAIVFDAYGTLFDVHSVIALCEQLWPGKGAA